MTFRRAECRVAPLAMAWPNPPGFFVIKHHPGDTALKWTLSLFAALALLGCDQPVRFQPTARDETGPLRTEVEALKARTAALEQEYRELVHDVPTIAYLTPQDHGYAPIQSSIGTLTVSLKDVSAFANGSRIRLEFGNPLAARITRLTAHITYGVGLSGDTTMMREKNHVFEAELVGGTWQAYTVDLADIPPTRLGYVTISNLQAEQMRMGRD